MTPDLVLGGCVLLAAHSQVDPGKWVGWEHTLSLEIAGSETCHAIGLDLGAGWTLALARGRATMAALPDHALGPERLEHRLDDDGGIDVVVHLPELGPGDVARLELVMTGGIWGPFAWTPQTTPSLGPWTLRRPRQVTVSRAEGILGRGRHVEAASPIARVDLLHPGATRPDPLPDADDVPVATLASLDLVPRGWLADRAPQGGQAQDLGLTDPDGYARLVAAVAPETRLARWSADTAAPLPEAPWVAVRDGAPQLHPHDPLPMGVLHFDDGSTAPFDGHAPHSTPTAAPATRTTSVEVTVLGPTLDRAWREGVTRLDTVTVRWTDEGARQLRLPFARPMDPAAVWSDCDAWRVSPEAIVLAASRRRDRCTVSLRTDLAVPWGEPLVPDAPVVAATATWPRRDGTLRTGRVHHLDDGFWIEAIGDDVLIPPGRGAAGWLEHLLTAASLPEPGIPLVFRRQEGWDVVTDLLAVIRSRTRVLDAPSAPPVWQPRPLHAARRSGVLFPAETAWLLALHLRQARRDAHVAFVTRHDVPVPIGVEAVLVRVRTAGGEGWLDPDAITDTPFVIPEDLRGRPAITTEGMDRTPD